MKTENPETINWYAARFASGGALICRRLQMDGIETYKTNAAPGIWFLRCASKYVSTLLDDYWGRLYFYRDSLRRAPEPIEDSVMQSFILVTRAQGKVINLGPVTPSFLEGQKVRVKDGVFRGAEGVIRRIKGDRRLVVSIAGVTAVATCYIPADMLEAI